VAEVNRCAEYLCKSHARNSEAAQTDNDDGRERLLHINRSVVSRAASFDYFTNRIIDANNRF